MTRAPDHRSVHDPLAISALAARDLLGSELRNANAVVAACRACASVVRDLRAIALALPTLPRPLRERDFRLTVEDAARLRRPGWRSAFRRALRPLAVGATALGLAGMLVTPVLLPLPADPAESGNRGASGVARPMLSDSGSSSVGPETVPPSVPVIDPNDVPRILLAAGLGLFLIDWGTQLAGRPSRRR